MHAWPGAIRTLATNGKEKPRDMSYIQQSLLPQESIVATTTLHPIIFWKPLRNAALTLLVVGFGHWAAVGLFNDPAASPEAHAFLQTWVVGAVAGLLALVTVTGALCV
jgi:hypothetical protein